MGARWKQLERDTAAWVTNDEYVGERQMSQGTAAADIFRRLRDQLKTVTVTFESKARQDVPQWLIKAFDQRKLNLRLHPGAASYVILHSQSGRGVPVRHFLATEVDFKGDDFDEVSSGLDEVAAQLAAAITSSDMMGGRN